MIRFECDCGAKLEADDDQEGHEFECPNCGEGLSVPSSEVANGQVSVPIPLPPTSRIKWTCPGCNQDYAVPSIDGLLLCPSCTTDPINITRPYRRSNWTLVLLTASFAIPLIVGTSWFLTHSGMPVTTMPAAVPIPDKPSLSEALSQFVETQKSTDEALRMLNESRETIKESRAKADRARKRVTEAYIAIGSLDPEDAQWLKQIDKKAERIEKGAEEKFTDSEIIFGSRFDLPLADTIQKQISKEGSPMERAVAATLKRLKGECRAKIQHIKATKLELKDAVVADDTENIATIRNRILELQTELRGLINAPLKPLVAKHLAVGQVGSLSPYYFSITHVDSANSLIGYLFVNVGEAWESWDCKLVGIATKGFSKNEFIRPGSLLTYAVLTTSTHRTHQLLELHACDSIEVFTDEEFADAARIIDDDSENALTDDEKALSQRAKESHENMRKEKLALEAEEMRVMAEAEVQKEAKAKERRSQSFLDSGRLLLKKGNSSGARKQFEKAVVEDPKSEPGKEAAKLLEALP